MRTLVVENIEKVKKVMFKIEKKINVKIFAIRPIGRLTIEGNELDEFIAEKVIQAVDFGFDLDDALLLKRENFFLKFVDIKSHTPRRNLKEVRARVIGTGGKAKRAIEELTGSIIVIHANKVGLISDAKHLDSTIQGVISLIQGSKHGNVFSYLEKRNAGRRNLDEEDLGLKKKFVGKLKDKL